MDFTLDMAVFAVLAIIIVVFSVLTVTTKRILRSVTYLLFVLLATAGIYFQLNYSFLGTVQIMIYVGGITVLYVFAILLISSRDSIDHSEPAKKSRTLTSLLLTVVGFVVCAFIVVKNVFRVSSFQKGEVEMAEIGRNMLGMEKFQYLIPFELMGILLLASIIGAIVIARKR